MSQSLAVRFADETGLHGLKPFFVARGRAERVIWFAMLATSYCLIFRGVFMTALQYANRPTFSEVSFFTPEEFPPFAFCHSHWGSLSRLDALGLTVSDYLALARTLVEPPIFLFNNVTPEHALNLENAFADHARLLSKVGDWDMDELMMGLLERPEDVISVFPSNGLIVSNTTMGKSVKLTGPCYIVRPSAKIDNFNVDFISMNALLRRTVPPSLAKDTVRFVEFFVGGTAEYLGFGGSVGLADGLSYWISMHARRVKRCRQPCRNYSPAESAECRAAVIYKHCTGFGKKMSYTPRVGMKVRDVASWALGDGCPIELKSQIGVKMDELCPSPCDELVYDVIPSYIGHAIGNHSIVHIAFGDATKSMLVEEKVSVTFDAFLSNVGGQISLWSGASLITILHVFMFCWFKGRGTRLVKDGSN